ncbi:BglG family transcription antiterminator [Anaerococcus marasmi]|uniref:BglG family transcription antiterminator n=1 Tax=Anaerococcus marasmi TaxID=2057797 RepID=UPI001319DB62|nr:PTS sugar transporter subunit IIA [Anaerococcus marasmi]
MKQDRLIKIIENLILTDEIQTISDISKNLGVSERTVRTDLDQIEIFLSSYRLKLVRKPGVGVWVEGKEENKIKFLNDLNNKDIENRYSKQWVINSILIDILINEGELNKEYFSRKYFVSKSLLNKYITDLKGICVNNNLDVRINSKHYFYIYGNQMNKVNFLYKLLKNKINKDYITEQSDFVINMFIEVSELLKEWFEEGIDESISNKQIEDITYFIISIMLMPDFSMCKDYIDKNIYGQILKFNLNLDGFIYNLEKKIKRHISSIEKKYIIIKIYEKLIIFDKYKIDELNLKSNLILDDYINNLYELFNFEFKIDKNVYCAFINHLSQIIYRAKNKLSIYNPLNIEIKENYKKYFYITKIINSSFNKILRIEINDDEIAYISLYMYIILENRTKKIKVGVICQYGVGVSKSLIFRLENEYPNIKFYSIGINDYYKYNKLDMYLSTVNTDLFENFIMISPFLDEGDKARINKHLGNLENNYSLIQKYHIEIIDFEITSKELLKLSCIKLHELGYVKEGYYDSVLDREKIGSTEIGNGVVLTHGIPKLVNESVIYFNILKKPVLWKDEEVDLVVILSLTEDDSKKSIDLNWLWKFLNSDKLKGVRNVDRKEEFIELILSN